MTWLLRSAFHCYGFILALQCWLCLGNTYTNKTKLYEDKLGTNSGYNPAVRPALDQTKHTLVEIEFTIISIVGLIAVSQQFIINGAFSISWTDEILQWNPADYGGLEKIRPFPVHIWRPRMVLSNTIDDRDLFEDDYAPLEVNSDGSASWTPGSLFPSTCDLDMKNYPFDYQTCTLEYFSMGHDHTEIHFFSRTGKVDLGHYHEHGEFEIAETKIEVFNDNQTSRFNVIFRLRRLPGFFLINIVMPVVMLSFLNIMVFVIPVDSGEKISYSITVLLALAVFMSVISDQMPRSSTNMPLISIYMFVLFIISVSTVLVTLWSVSLHHKRQTENKRQDKATLSLRGIARKLKSLQRVMNPAKIIPEEDEPDAETTPSSRSHTNYVINLLRNDDSVHQDSNVSIPPKDNWNNTDCDKKDENDSGSQANWWMFCAEWIEVVSFWLFLLVWVVVTTCILGLIGS